MNFADIISDRYKIAEILDSDNPAVAAELCAAAYEVKKNTVGECVYLRGLVEISNICRKNCLYCGIRRDNRNVAHRYEITVDEVVEAAKFAADNGYASLVIQGGERNEPAFCRKITDALQTIMKIRPRGEEEHIGVTLSLGEQSEDVYREWFEAGAKRYLLRIEASDRELYEKIHPQDDLHSYDARVQALEDLRKCGYQVGTGVMIGLPFQTSLNLADDLLFFKNLDIDMCGMGPYIEHSDTPLYKFRDKLLPVAKRMDLSIKMVALLRLMMPDINIAATTAMQALDPLGREKAIMAGANVLMPNITIVDVRADYQIYQNKPGVGEDAALTSAGIVEYLKARKIPIGFCQWGDSIHYRNRKV